MSKRKSKHQRDLDFYEDVAAPWAKAGGTCFKCKANRAEHCHHILTRGAYIVLMLCPWNLVPLCCFCHLFAHDHSKKFMAWLETVMPGIEEKLWTLAREWLKKPLEEIKELYRTLPEWEEHWRAA